MTDEGFMCRCLELAQEACENGNTAVGSIIVCSKGNIVISEAGEENCTSLDVTAHAEILAINRACSELDTKDLSDCTLFTTAEPCWMCSYAIREARIRRVVYGTRTLSVGGAVSTDFPLLIASVHNWSRPPEVVGGVLEEKCLAIRREDKKSTISIKLKCAPYSGVEIDGVEFPIDDLGLSDSLIDEFYAWKNSFQSAWESNQEMVSSGGERCAEFNTMGCNLAKMIQRQTGCITVYKHLTHTILTIDLDWMASGIKSDKEPAYIDIRRLALPENLVKEFEEWNDTFQNTANGFGDECGFPDSETQSEFEDHGRELATKFQEALGNGYEVNYRPLWHHVQANRSIL